MTETYLGNGKNYKNRFVIFIIQVIRFKITIKE